jgi:4-diphosphocytidyl-2-C-methyl-D-erythritol kinase
MKAIYDVPAPAKLNLFLHITGRRNDGYHLLQSAFALIDWCDLLHFECRADGVVSREDLGTPLPDEDLIVRAARALQGATGTLLGAHIGVNKRIPTQAGMGGGSSDAASCLLALNRLWRLGLPLAVLSRMGLALGADVPFFLAGNNAWVEGVGEQLTPVELPLVRYLVARPPEGLQTSRIFCSPELKRDSETATISGFAADPFGFGRNDLQDVARGLCPGIDQGLWWLGRYGLAGRMTGSGSAVFARVDEVRDKIGDGRVDMALRDVPAGFEVRLCSGLGAHPLVGWACDSGLSR